jgi:hypothetical protein
MAWLVSRHIQMLVGGCAGAALGSFFAILTVSGHSLALIFVGFVLGQLVALLLAKGLQPGDSPKRPDQSLRLLVAGGAGAVLGSIVASLVDVEQVFMLAFAGYVLGNVVAMITAPTSRPERSPRSADPSHSD